LKDCLIIHQNHVGRSERRYSSNAESKKFKNPQITGKGVENPHKLAGKREKGDLFKFRKSLKHNRIDEKTCASQNAFISRFFNLFSANLGSFFSKTTDMEGFSFKTLSESLVLNR